MNKIFSIIAVALILPCIISAQSILLKGGTVIPMNSDKSYIGDVLITDGKIAEISDNIKVSAKVKTLDMSGKFIMPGIIDAHSHLALQVVNEASKPVTAEVQVGDAVNPYDIGIYRALAGGVTTIHAMHGSANAIGGECETLKLKYGNSAEEMKMAGAPRTIKFALGENPMRVHGSGKNIIPGTRMGMEFIFRDAFNRALKYREQRNKYNNKSSDKYIPYDPQLETLVDILEGEIIIHCHSYRADEILMLLKVLKDYGIERIVYQHVNEGFKVAPELAAYGAMASVFSDWWAYKFEVYYSTAFNAAILTRNGVITSINSDDAELIRHLNHEAAKTQRYGDLTDYEALSLVTINPAKQLGIEDRVGTLEVGKDADIAIFSAHPLSVYAIPEYTIVDGIIEFNKYDDESDQRILIDPYDENQTNHLISHGRKTECMEGIESH